MIDHCAAPWVESVLYRDGWVKACCRSPVILGNWHEQALKDIWNGEPFRKFREEIARGAFPDANCRMCYSNGTARSLEDELRVVFQHYRDIVRDHLKLDCGELDVIRGLFQSKTRPAHPLNIAQDYLFEVRKLKTKASGSASLVCGQALSKLETIGQIACSYLKKDCLPEKVAPFRQVNLISACNARCIHCLGFYKGEIFESRAPEKHPIDNCFFQPEDMISFFMNGSELFLYDNWREVAGLLEKNGVKFDISTNGILLKPDNARFLIDKNIVKYLNVSVDGATQETVESIRGNVDFKQLLENIDFLIEYAFRKKADFYLSLSFVLMKRNYKELPGLIYLAGQLKKGRTPPHVSVVCQGMENMPVEKYIDFLKKEHHSLIDRNELIEVFNKAYLASAETRVPVFAFYSYRLEDFISQGYPFPPFWYNTSAPHLNQGSEKDFDREFSFEPLIIKDNEVLIIKGHVKNTGRFAWDNISGPEDSNFRVGLKIYGQDNSQIKEARFYFNKEYVSPGSCLNFKFFIPVIKFPAGRYRLQINILKEHCFWLQDLGIPPETLFFEINGNVPSYGRKFVFDAFPLLNQSFLFRIKGTVENTGDRPWDTFSEPDDLAVKMGMKVFREGEPVPVIEERFMFDRRSILPGGAREFDFLINKLGLTDGRYKAKINVLRERCFWLDDIGIPGEEFDFEVRNPPLEPVKREKRNTYALSRAKDAKILYLAPTYPFFDKESGGNRLFELLKLIRKLKFRVSFFSENYYDSQENRKYIRALKKGGIRIIKDPDELLSMLEDGGFTVCILSWWHCAKKYMNLIRTMLPRAKIIVDSVDVHWVRQLRALRSELCAQGLPEVLNDKATEKEIYAKADLIWAVTEADRVAILQELPGSKTRIVSNIHHRSRMFSSPRPKGKGVIFVGSFKHPPNESAALWGYEICRRFRQESGVDFVYYIVGSYPTERIKALHDGEKTVVTGYVKDLRPYYDKSKAMIAPLRYGAGIKGKICHAIASGLPVITNDVGNEGLNLKDMGEALIAGNTDEFVARLRLVFAGKVDLKKLRNNALKKLLSVTGEKVVSGSIVSSFIYKPVVISMVSHNAKALLANCLDSIITKTKYPDYKIAVVLNGCKDGSLEMMRDYLKKYPGLIDLKYNRENEYFVRPNNYVINKYKRSDIVLVNNDIEILADDWLMNLHDAAYTSNKVGAAGGKILDPSGKISEAGAELHSDATGINIGRGEPADKADYNFPRYVGYVSGCLLYMRRDMIERFGALDEDFSPMYYEDSAWQYNLHKNGIQTIYTPDCVVLHREGSSAGTDIKNGMKRFQEINREKFLKKFAGVI